MDLYALIRGMRNHKGNEKEYIQNSLKECRREVRSPDMDNKATALLKLVYLEMFGHDMSWASFNVLEVMSSQKYLQKRVGYLAAVQTFRPDTEVLMLAENLLKKDLNSPQLPTIGLPLVTIPHVVNPSMANSLLTDLLPRLTHSSPAIRKKTIVTLYRLALVYPETLRPAWPKIKERLLDENEDSSVTAAIINVVCELGWRRPHDFLPLAPRLFELLVQGSNNWMAIKIIKLFATLVPLEPRLIKKLLPPLTTLIKTTPAMSLLYECINGIIQGGILDGAEGTVEGDEIARLCVSKLRGMLVVEGDPNLKYVALLAFTKIVASHPQLVALHSDVVVECIDDPDISIRTRALELVSGMVDGSNLMPIVERLLRQLREATPASASDDPINDRGMHGGVVPSGDSDDEEAAESLRRREARSSEAPPLPEDYRQSVIENILDMCSRDTYANISDFEWYIGILVDLVGHCPTVGAQASDSSSTKSTTNVAQSIGLELQNVAVRVKSVRPEAVAAAQSLIIVERRRDLFPASGNGAQAVLASVAWMVGEYPDLLPDPQAVLSSLLHTSSAQLPANILAIYIQAIPKVFARLTSNQERSWTASRKSQSDLLMARIIHFLEPLVQHPHLEVQERAVEYLELMRVTSEAIQAHAVEGEDDGFVDPPLLLTQAIPSLFMGQELNPVAIGALSKVPLTEGLDLDTPINDNLQILLSQADYDDMSFPDEDNVSKFYFDKPSAVAIQPAAAADYLEPKEATQTGSYQSEDRNIDPKDIAKKKAERRERYRDDPFYIDSERGSGTSTPLHNILKSSNGEELDIDSIPIMDLQLDSNNTAAEADRLRKSKASKKSRNKRVEIAQDETIGDDDAPAATAVPTKASLLSRPKKSLLHVDSSGLSSLSLSENATARETQLDFERRQQEEEEMAKAIKEVERARLEMQRAQERVEATHIPEEGTLVKRKKKKTKPKAPEEEKPVESEKAGDDAEGTTAVKKKKKKKAKEENVEEAAGDAGADVEAATVKTKRKKKRQINFDEQGDAPAA
ncbi:Adaptor protein complex AP-3 delta subunit [Aureobasidium pullulans]|uniref:AP-3 complex subunit delta n=1 Tax=Aureobasidium pullulans TaxID=5580 RepID=A0A4S9EVW6_AURPU|nr:Adaptor protein complex AP-3 delta subunit [Aureobasidium pullulans]